MNALSCQWPIDETCVIFNLATNWSPVFPTESQRNAADKTNIHTQLRRKGQEGTLCFPRNINRTAWITLVRRIHTMPFTV